MFLNFYSISILYGLCFVTVGFSGYLRLYLCSSFVLSLCVFILKIKDLTRVGIPYEMTTSERFCFPYDPLKWDSSPSKWTMFSKTKRIVDSDFVNGVIH